MNQDGTLQKLIEMRAALDVAIALLSGETRQNEVARSVTIQHPAVNVVRKKRSVNKLGTNRQVVLDLLMEDPTQRFDTPKVMDALMDRGQSIPRDSIGSTLSTLTAEGFVRRVGNNIYQGVKRDPEIVRQQEEQREAEAARSEELRHAG